MLINLVPLMEAQASSEIENIVTTNDGLFRAAHFALEKPLTPAVKEALRYREALHYGSNALASKPMTARLAAEICSIIVDHEMGVRTLPCTFVGNPATHSRTYTPSDGKATIEQHLSRWEEFVNTEAGIDPLIKMALAHYQFEAIHPFADGNGRTGRILNLLLLQQTKLLSLPILYLSGYIVRNKSDYYDRLNGVTREDKWEEWILFMLTAVELTASWTLQLIDKTEQLRKDTEETIRRLAPKLPAGDLTRLLFFAAVFAD